MQRIKMAVTTILTVALMMTWAVPAIAADLKKVNINSAELEELMTLDGIGEKMAARILAFRKKNGPFQNPADIMMVKGIGPKIFDRNKDLILIK
jgi:competence protein ComEA